MKTLIAALLFSVTWNQYETVSHIWPDGSKFMEAYPGYFGDRNVYTVELTTHTAKFKTREDVDLFMGNGNGNRGYLDSQDIARGWQGRPVIPGAFNFKVERVEEVK